MTYHGQSGRSLFLTSTLGSSFLAGCLTSVGDPATWHDDELISELEVSGPLLWVLVRSREFPHAADHLCRAGNICGAVIIVETRPRIGRISRINGNKRDESEE